MRLVYCLKKDFPHLYKRPLLLFNMIIFNTELRNFLFQKVKTIPGNILSVSITGIAESFIVIFISLHSSVTT